MMHEAATNASSTMNQMSTHCVPLALRVGSSNIVKGDAAQSLSLRPMLMLVHAAPSAVHAFRMNTPMQGSDSWQAAGWSPAIDSR